MNKIMFSGLYDHLDGIYAVICGNFEEPMIEAQNFLESAPRLSPGCAPLLASETFHMLTHCNSSMRRSRHACFALT